MNEFPCEKCKSCGEPSLMMCQRCKEDYCSLTCQTSDWNVHKHFCQEIPDLVPIWCKKNILNAASADPKASLGSEQSHALTKPDGSVRKIFMKLNPTSKILEDYDLPKAAAQDANGADAICKDCKEASQSLRDNFIWNLQLMSPANKVVVSEIVWSRALQPMPNLVPKVETMYMPTASPQLQPQEKVLTDWKGHLLRCSSNRRNLYKRNEWMVTMNELPPPIEEQSSEDDSKSGSPPETDKNVKLMETKPPIEEVSSDYGSQSGSSQKLPESVERLHISKFYARELEQIPLREGNNVRLFVLSVRFTYDNHICLTVADITEKTMLRKMNEGIIRTVDYGQCLKTQERGFRYVPSVYELCLVFCQGGDLYRAESVAPPSVARTDQIQVRYIDYGNFATVPHQDVYPITKDLMYPVYANQAIVSGLTHEERKAFQANMTKVQPVINASVKLQDNHYVLTLLNKDEFLFPA